MKIRSFMSRAGFAFAKGSSLGQKLHLCYHSALKPSLAHRGLARYHPQRIVAFGLKASPAQTLKVHVRDNGVGPVTIAEFFSPQSRILPPDLPLVQPRVIYDLGANLGIASLYFQSLYPAAQIYGFEPLPENLEVCGLNYAQLSPPSRVMPWAVGLQTGTAIFDCQNDSRGGRLESSPHDPRLTTIGKLKVQIYSLRDLIQTVGLPVPDLIKIDVEGAECDVLRGLEDHYAAVKWIYIETHGAELKAWCLKWLQERQYRIWPGADETCLWAGR
jgi:FkbM family methyltransferase